MSTRRLLFIALSAFLCVFALGGSALIYVSDKGAASRVSSIEIVD
jgi:hypothetical protein